MDTIFGEKPPSLADVLNPSVPQAPEPERRNWFVSGVSSGIDQFQALSGRGVQALGDAIASKNLADVGRDIAERNWQEAAASGRPDLEQRPSAENWTQYPAWAGYQFAKQLPTMAAALAAYKLGGSAAARYIGAEAAAASTVPQIMAGGLAASAVTYPQAVGSMYDEAVQAGRDGPGEARKALMYGVPYAAMESIQPATLVNMLEKGLAGGFLRRVGTAAFVGSATETITEGLQTGMEQSFRPDLTPREKMSNIVEGAIAGGVVGGMFGAFGGIRKLKTADPAKVTNEELKKVSDEGLKLPPGPSSDKYTQQPEMGLQTRNELEGTDQAVPPVGDQRPFGKVVKDDRGIERYEVTDQELLAGLAAVEQRMQSETRSGNDAIIREQIRQELDLRQFGPPEQLERQAIANDMRRIIGPGPLPGRSQIYEDMIVPSVAQPPAAEPITRTVAPGPMMGRSPLFEDTYSPNYRPTTPAEVDTRPFDGGQPGFGLFDTQEASLPEARRPAPPAPLDPKVSAMRTFAAGLFGETKSKSVASFINNLQATDEAGVTAAVMDEINKFDERGKDVPDRLMSAAKTLGIINERGEARDFDSELQAAIKKYEAKQEDALRSGKGLAEARAYLEKTVKPLQAQAAAVRAALVQAEQMRAARQRSDAVAAAAKATETATKAELRKRGTIEQRAQILAAAPPVLPQPTFEQRYLNRNSFARSASPVVETAPVEAAPVATGPDISGDKYKTLQGRFANRGAPQQRVAETVAPTLQERFVSRGAADATAAVGPLIVTARQEQAQQGSAVPQGAAKFAPTFDQRFASRGSITRVGAPEPAAVAPNSQQAQIVQQLKEAKLARIAQSGDVGPDLKQAASEALAGVQAMQPGADAVVDDVLAQYAERTGDIVFNRADPALRAPPLSSQRLDRILQIIGGKLPLVARNSIHLAETAEQLPDVVKRAAQRRGIGLNEIRGVLYDGKVHVVLDRISSEAELEEVINHEVFGHGGARALFGDQRQAVLSTAFKLAGGVEGLRAIARSFGVEAQLNKYIPVRELTDADKVNIVDELLAQAAGVGTGKFRTAMLSWANVFKTMLVRALRAIGLDTAAERLGAFGTTDLAAMMTQMRAAVESGAPMDGAMAFLRTTPQGMVESTKNLMTSATNIQDWFKRQEWTSLSLKANQMHLYTSTASHIVDFFGKLFDRPDGSNPLREWWNTNVMRGVVEQRLAHFVQIGYRAYEALQKVNRAATENIGKMMGYTFYRVDPRKSWEEHTWLQGAKNEAELKAHVKAANKLYNDGRQTGASEVYDNFVLTNEAMYFAQHAISLYNLLVTDKDVAEEFRAGLLKHNPMEKFLGAVGTFDNLKNAREFWLAETNNLLTLTDNYVAAQRGLAVEDAQTKDKISRSTSALMDRVVRIRDDQNKINQAPYFHLGRFGQYVLSFHLARNAQNQIDEGTMAKVAEAFDKAGIQGITIPPDSGRGNVFIRFEKLSQLEAATKVARDLAKQGVLINDGDKAVAAFTKKGEELVNQYDMSQGPMWVQRLLESIRNTRIGDTPGLTDEQNKMVTSLNRAFERHVQQVFVNLLPETSLAKVMVHRNYVPGFSDDMIRSYLFRTQVGGRALANLFASAKLRDATDGIYAATMEARTDPDLKKAMLTQNVANEIFMRDANRPYIVGNSFIDTWRAVNHAFFLGMSPSYVAVNMTQIGVLLWPELAKKQGFIGAAKSIAKVTPAAMKIMKTTLIEGGKLGWKNLPDASITPEVLKEAGINKEDGDFIMRVVNSGLLDIGSQSREIGRVVEGQADSKLDLSLRYASAMGYYSEMASRLIAAMAAKEAYGPVDPKNEQQYEAMIKYVDTSVRQSMLMYETWNQSRATGRMGLAGEFTPVMTSFQQYTFQLTEKLYREFHAAFRDAAKTPAEKKAARQFLAGHLAAVVTLTGTLGMPMAAVFAAAFDRLVDVFSDDDDEPTNITAAYRNFLTDMFGKNAGEVIARGLPRAFGFDISQRAGEQDMLPYLHLVSRLLTDRRQWEDKLKDGALQAMGSPVGMAANIIVGFDKFAQGDVIDGMASFMPNAIKGPVKAFKLTTDGYVDKKGNKLPITEGASDVVWQALGFNPARRAEYMEEYGVQASLKGDMIRRASHIREDLAKAIEGGDAEAIREALRAAQRFDAKNPSFQILKSMGSVMRSRARERIKADMLDSPMGTKPEMADRTRFGNFD